MSRPQRSPTFDTPSRRQSHHHWGGAHRGQSVALDYTLALGVAALAVTGLFAAAGDFVTSQREQVVRTELGVVGEQLTNKLVAADRLVQAGNETDRLVINASMPQRVAGASYTVSVTQNGTWLNLTSNTPEISVAVKLETETDIATGDVAGGRLDIVYDPDENHLEVQSG